MTIIDTDELEADALLGLLQQVAADCFPRDRDRYAAAIPLSPGSLVGSYFRAPDPTDPEAEVLWLEGSEAGKTIEGQIVGEPFRGPYTVVYAVEFFGELGAKGHQRMVELERMIEQRWFFYDDKGWLDSWSPHGSRPESDHEALRQEHGQGKR